MSLLSRFEYKVDIALVLDSTGGMANFWDNFAECFPELCDRLVERIEECGRTITQLRVRVVDFGDFAFEGNDAIRQSPFFTLPEEQALLDAHIRNIDCAYRGGDMPENALEALWTALDSDWTAVGNGRTGRHVVVLVTDAYPLDFGERNGCLGYNRASYPENLSELKDIWHDRIDEERVKISPRLRRLALVAPRGKDEMGHSWEEFIDWDRIWFRETQPCGGCADLTLDGLVDAIMYAMYEGM